MDRRRILQFAIGPIGSAFFGLVSVPVVAWFFTVEDVGRIAMLQVAISFSVSLCCLGLDQAYVREYHESDDKPALLKNAIAPGLAVLIAIIAITFMTSATMLSRLLFNLDSVAISIVIALCVFIAFISRFLSLILRMQERGIAYSMSQILPKLVFLALIGCFVITHAKNSFENLLLAHAVSLFCVLIIFGRSTVSIWFAALKKSIDHILQLKLLRFGLPLVFAGLAFWGLNVMDRIFLRGMSTYEQLGVYSVAVSIAGVAVIFSSIFNTIWMPTVYKWIAENKNLDVVQQVSDNVLAAIYFTFVFFGLFSWVLPFLFPSSYSDVQYIVMACAAGPLLYMLSETTAVGIGATRRTGYAMMASGCAVVLNGLGNYFLIPFYGAAGAAVATAIAFLFFFIIRTELSIWLWKKRERSKLYLTTISCVMLAVYSALLSKSNPYTSVGLSLVFLIVGFFVFSSALLALRQEALTIFKNRRAGNDE